MTQEELKPASVIRRIAAIIIDILLVACIGGGILLYLDYTFSRKLLSGINFVFVPIIFFTPILVLKDTFSGSSLGKKIFSLRVVNCDEINSKPSTRKLMIRNILLIMWPFELFFFIYTKGHQRLSDKFFDTKVVLSSENHGEVRLLLALIVLVTAFYFFDAHVIDFMEEVTSKMI